MKTQCTVCGSMVDDVAGVCPVCGSTLANNTQNNAVNNNQNVYQMNQQEVNMTQNQSAPQNPYNVNYSDPLYQQPTGYQQPYNYMDPNQQYGYQNQQMGMQPNQYMMGQVPMGPKKKVFAILSIVFAIVSILSLCSCVGLLSGIFAVLSVVFGIIALVKKQVKVPAIIGMILGGVALLVSMGIFGVNSMFRLVYHTSVQDIFAQTFDLMDEVPMLQHQDVVLYMQGDAYELNLYGNYESYTGSGTYSSAMYTDDSAQDELQYAVLYAMSQDYKMKNVELLTFVDNNYQTKNYAIIVPDNWKPGDDLYLIDDSMYSLTGSFSDIKMETIKTAPTY